MLRPLLPVSVVLIMLCPCAAVAQDRVFGSEAGMIFTNVKPAKTADFEFVVRRLMQALEASPSAVRRQQAKGWKVFRSIEPGEGGSVLYIYVMDPAVPGTDYTVSTVFQEAYPQESQSLYEKYSGAFATLQTLVNLRLVAGARQIVSSEKPIEATAPSRGPSAGSGFLVGPQGLLVTAFHVVEDATAIVVRCPGRRPVQAIVRTGSATTDVAVLQLNTFSADQYLTFGDTAGLGERVFTIGYPAQLVLGADPKFSEGAVNAVSGPMGDAAYLQISAPIQPGNSGGPLLNERGEVLGMVVASAAEGAFMKYTGSLPQNVNWALKAAYLRPLLGQPALPKVAADRGTAISRATQATCAVAADRK